MNQLSLRARRSNPAHHLFLALLILISFSPPIEARTLNLSKRKIKDVSSLKVREGVTNLKLQKNKITEIAPLQLPSTLRSLNIAHNKITDLNQLELNPGLESLKARSNEIRTVEGLVLPDSLQVLSLTGNDEINDIGKLILPNALEEFSLLFCNIDDQNINGLVLNSNLDTLHLAFNDLTSLDGIQFNSNLTILSLNRNLFTEMDWSSIPTSLSSLDFSSNRDITNYDEMVLPPNLKTFGLNVLFFDNPSFMNGNLPDSLTLLVLSRNFITSLEGFEIPPNLEELDLEHNSLSDFDYELPESMRLLNLRDNLISKRTRREIRARYRDMPDLKIKF